jgi:hypothetical protein
MGARDAREAVRGGPKAPREGRAAGAVPLRRGRPQESAKGASGSEDTSTQRLATGPEPEVRTCGSNSRVEGLGGERGGRTAGRRDPHLGADERRERRGPRRLGHVPAGGRREHRRGRYVAVLRNEAERAGRLAAVVCGRGRAVRRGGARRRLRDGTGAGVVVAAGVSLAGLVALLDRRGRMRHRAGGVPATVRGAVQEAARAPEGVEDDQGNGASAAEARNTAEPTHEGPGA